MNLNRRIIYIYDALCGWCYGFSEVIVTLEKTFQDILTFQVLNGGMIMGDRVKPISETRWYIESAYPIVEAKTGVQFGEAYLNGILKSGQILSDSLPPALAFNALKGQTKLTQIGLASSIQRLLYIEGKNLNEPDSYRSLSEECGISFELFLSKFKSEETLKETQIEFQQVKSLGVNGFPTVLFDSGNRIYPITSGYSTVEILSNRIHHLVENINKQ
ncbi:MAG: DsbA family protein [Chloroherpetonaceae bacterium]|nr:DsbA family protein [Chloroherpetonaceae bacterium]